MAVFRVERTKDYTVMCNYHLRDKSLSLKAKGLLSQMLSLPENWDYTLSGLASINRESKDAIRTAIIELEQAGYVHRRQTTDALGKFSVNEYVIYERPMPLSGTPLSENPPTGTTPTEIPTQLNIDQENKDQSSTDSILFRATAAPEPRRTEASPYRALILENIDYDTLRARNPLSLDVLDEIVELLTETVTAQRKTIRVSGSDFPQEVVKSRLLKLTGDHVQFAMDCLRENTTQVRNMKQYLLAVLFNAPTTMYSYYNARANYVLYGKAQTKTGLLKQTGSNQYSLSN